MPDLPTSTLTGALGFLIGVGFGATARWTLFCTLGAIVDGFYGSDHTRLRSWALAVAISLLLTQAMDQAGWVDLSASIYLTPDFGWLGAVFGGLLFGFGMALVGTCGYGTLVRLGNGDLRSLVVFLVLGISAYMTLRGLFGVVREAVIEPTNLDLSWLGSQSLVDLLAWSTGLSPTAARWGLVAAVVAACGLCCRSDPAFRRASPALLGGLLMGLLVTAGWYVTGALGQDEFDPVRVESLTFVSTAGESLVYLMTFTGATLDFGIGAVGGVICGSLVVSLARGEFRFEIFDSQREMRRHLGGAALMGFGGVTALGCTVGQGITGLSTLALSAPLALGAIFLGAWLGLRYLAEGRLFAFGGHTSDLH